MPWSGRLDTATRRKQLSLPLLLFAVYFLLKPFYFFPSGSPQIGDFLALGLCVLLLVIGTPAPSPATRSSSFFAGAFVVYSVVVNVVWAALLGEIELLKAPSFLLFNFLLFFLTLMLADRYGDLFHRYTLGAVATSLLLVVLVSVVDPGITRREDASFENPNQLGYWSLLSISIFLLCSLRVRVHWLLRVAACLASFYLIALSLSKAAMISSLLLFALAFAAKPRHLFAVLPLVLLLVLGSAGDALVENVSHRLTSIGDQADDSMGRRGYALFARFPQYLIFGAGQGVYERFYDWSPREFHSTMGTILFCYGAIGMSLFLLFLLQIFATAGLYRFAFVGPAFLYGVAHQGMRFSLFWMLFAIVVSVRPVERVAAAARVARQPRAGVRRQPGGVPT